MVLRVGSTVMDVADVPRAARFWCDVLGYEPRDGADAAFMVLSDPRRLGPNVSLQRSEEPKRGADRVHLDLYADDQAFEVHRIEGLGGRCAPWGYPPGADYVVMEDLDGNEFCVVQK